MPQPEITIARTVEPITLAEARRQVRLEADETADDARLELLIAAARAHIETRMRRRLIRAEQVEYPYVWDAASRYRANCFPLPYGPVQAVLAVYIHDSDDNQTLVPSSVYRLDTTTKPALLYLADGQTWPVANWRKRNPIQIEYLAGYAESPNNLPEDLRLAMLMLVSRWYDANSDQVLSVGATKLTIDDGLDALTLKYAEGLA